MCTAGFPEPRTFGKRLLRVLGERKDDFDIVHDNQVLGYGMLEIEKLGLPLLTTLHHPISYDRRIDIASPRTRGASSRSAAGTASCGCRAGWLGRHASS